jgi:hypothetical protein
METKKYLIPIFYAKMNTMRDKNCHPWRIPEKDLQSPPVVVLKLWRLVRGSIYTMPNTDGFVKSPTSALRCILHLPVRYTQTGHCSVL